LRQSGPGKLMGSKSSALAVTGFACLHGGLSALTGLEEEGFAAFRPPGLQRGAGRPLNYCQKEEQA
jgi:hypothetical protein